MSLLLVFSRLDASAADLAELVERATRSARRQGFEQSRPLSWPEGQALWFETPGNPGRSGACVVEADGWAAYTGSMHWQGLTGEPLLRRLLQSFRAPKDMPLRDIAGSFAMIFSHNSAVWLFNDAVGLQQLYRCLDGAVYSSSLLLCRHLMRRPRIHRLRAQEYVLRGSAHGLQTPIDGITMLDPTQLLDLRKASASTLHAAEAWRIGQQPGSPAEAVDKLASMIAQDFKGLAQAFGSDIGMALSGGFDSRLILAALDHQQLAPKLFVYGQAGDGDVRIARAKAEQLGLAIECTDKQAVNAALPPLDRQGLQDNIAFFDGLPIDGVFDRGIDQATRRQQLQQGRLNLNGGGGEIFRNFFYLPDRAYSASDLVGAFYSNWLPAAIPAASERQALHDATADSILNNLGLPSGTGSDRRRALTRRDIELVYSLFRLRFWMGRNNSLAVRNGAFMTPLVSPRLVELAAAVPLAWKTYGALEAAIIQRLSPRVASGDSNYGFSFSSGPTPAYRRYINATLYRPIMARRWSARIRRALGRNPTAALPAEWQQAWPLQAVDWIDPAFLTHPDQLNRLMTLQAVLDDSLCPVD